jgi:hypothetical protein
MYRPSRDRTELHLNAAALLASLCLSDHADVPEIVSRVAAVTGRRIYIEQRGDRDWETVTGLVSISQTTDAATVLVRKSDPRWYQFHSVLHELCHILFGHPGCNSLPGQHPGRAYVRAGYAVRARGVASPDFDRELEYSNHEAVIEAEAERLSYLLSEVVLRPRHARDEAVFG